MTRKEAILHAVTAALTELARNHPHGLRSIGSANAREVLTRFGVDGQAAELAQIGMEVLEEDSGLSAPEELAELLSGSFSDDGTLRKPFTGNCCGTAPGDKDARGLFTHPQLLFTAVNQNGRRYGIEADASQSKGGGLNYYQDWRSAVEVQASGVRVQTAWDAKDGRVLVGGELGAIFGAAAVSGR
jgi:hypothetical protein